jgi:uncharacterized protein with HEPN domain
MLAHGPPLSRGELRTKNSPLERGGPLVLRQAQDPEPVEWARAVGCVYWRVRSAQALFGRGLAKRLLDAHSACVAIQSFTSDIRFEEFEASALIRSAVEGQFEIIGESLGRAQNEDPSLEQLLPEIPRIVGLRNRLIHGYDSVDDQIVWDLVQSKLLPLRSKLAEALSNAGFPPDP